MATTTRFQRKYDHRLRELVPATGNIEVALKRGVPHSTARGWAKATKAEVVTIDVADMNNLQLQQEVLALRKRITRLVALLRLVMVLVKIAGSSLANARMLEQAEKHKLLRAIERARSVLPLRIVLGVLRLSHSRYH